MWKPARIDAGIAPAAMLASAALAVVVSCGRPGSKGTGGPVAESGSKPAASAGETRRPRQAPLAGERVKIPGGSFMAGSLPGEDGRRPELEPRLGKVTLGSFTIDKLPYPNDPNEAPRTRVTRRDAVRLCAERGARLCTELEWERACKGPRSNRFAGSEVWDPRCGHEPDTCASGFEVLGMGSLREWTASDVIPPEHGQPPRAAVRGAPDDAPAGEHRCARRRGIDGSVQSPDLGFRCCKGPPNAAVVREPRLGQTFRRVRIPATRLEVLLGTDERTRELAHDIMLFREPEAANTVVARGPGDRKGFSFTVSPLVWNPVAGAEFLIVTARSGKDTSFVVVYHVMAKDKYALVASFVMLHEPGPVALAYSGYIRPRLHFSTCWGCPGETGKILYRAPESATVLQP